MEFSPENIAKLVLGYLKEQKCQTAFHEFLNSSVHLKQHAVRYKRGKYFVTRVGGLSLVQYLKEYAMIYTLVQERLEASEYYEERDPRTSLVQQLLYLLSGGSATQSRTSTPVDHLDNVSLCQQNNGSNSKSMVQSHYDLDAVNNSSFRRISSETNITSALIPGNLSANFSFLNNSSNISSKVDKSTNTDDEVDANAKEKSQECEEIFQQTFLENTDLIRKLAENINKEVSAKSTSTDNPSEFSIGQELDDAAIETIIKRTAKDPVLVNLIGEIIGTPDEAVHTENASSPDESIQNTSQETAVEMTPKKTSVIAPADSIKRRLRSSRKTCSNAGEGSPSIEEQNNEAVQCIIAAALSGEKKPSGQESDAGCTTRATTIGEVFNGPHDNLVHAEILAGSSNQNSMYVNTTTSGGLLMLQPNVTASCSSLVTTKTVQVDPVKPYYVISGQPFINVNIPQTPLKLNTVLTEQDIMTMPTIIVCDNNQQSTSTQIMPASTTSGASTQNNLRTIAPRRKVDRAESLSEYITLYKCNEAFSPVISQPQLESSPPNPRANPKGAFASTSATCTRLKKKSDKKSHPTSTIKKSPPHSLTQIPTNENTAKKIHTITQSSTNNAGVANSHPVIQKPNEHVQDTLKSSVANDSLPQIMTPQMKVSIVTESRSRSTPRNGSHVRQLDFSTPDKWLPSLRKANTSPKLDKLSESKETPVKAPKAGTSETIRTSLFKSPDLEVPVLLNKSSSTSVITEDKGSKVRIMNSGSGEVMTVVEPVEDLNIHTRKSSASWDADLRALTGSSEPEPNVNQKQKRKHSADSGKGHNNSKKFKENLNKTEDDGLKIEMALASFEAEAENENINVVTAAVVEDTKKPTKPASKRRDRITTKKAMSVCKGAKSEKETKKEREKQAFADVNQLSSNLPIAHCALPLDRSNEGLSVTLDEQIRIEEEPNQKCVVINRNMKSRIRRKCNMENSVKKTPVPEEIILTNITKIKSCEVLDESKNKLILSPSKLNANKRSLVETETRTLVLDEIMKRTSIEHQNQEPATCKFVSPETTKSSANLLPGSPKRNIMPILETPVKFESVAFPKTPGFLSPPTIDTPFTKAVIDQLTEVDINDIPTPKFPITPNFPFTPALRNEQSPFANRGTDYSTSSSYYQPSDNEQNKSIEQLIEECHRLESHPAVKALKSQDTVESEHQGIAALITPPTKTLQEPENSESTKETPATQSSNSNASKTQVSETIQKMVSDKVKQFNESMIGKKNLHLIKMFSSDAEKEEEDDSSSSSNATSTESDSSTTSSDESDSSDSSCSQSTKIATQSKNVTPYSLRPRKSISYNSSAEVAVSTEVKNSPKVSADKEKSAEKVKEKKPLTFHDGLLQEMEEKRQRTIARFKTTKPDSKLNYSKSKTSNVKLKKKPLPRAKKVENKGAKPPAKKQLKQLSNNSCVTTGSIENLNTTNNSTDNQIIKSNQILEPLTKAKRPESRPEKKGALKPSNQNEEALITLTASKEAEAALDSDDEIILHLSSDDENLEPFEMVETELLEYSTSSTPIADHSTTNEDSNLDQPQEQFEPTSSDLKPQTGIQSLESEEVLDQQAESLVNGLKEWGIHLIPNKSAKKSVTLVETVEQSRVQLKQGAVETDTIGQQHTDTSKCFKTEQEKTYLSKQQSTCAPKCSQTVEEKPQPPKQESRDALRCSKTDKDKLHLSKLKTHKPDTPKTEKEITRIVDKRRSSKDKPDCINPPSAKPEEKLETIEKQIPLKQKLESTSKFKKTKAKEDISDKLKISKEKISRLEENIRHLKNLSSKAKLSKLEKAGTSKEERKEKLNDSLEDGEVVTDYDCTPSKENRVGKGKSEKSKRADAKNTSEPLRSSGFVKEIKIHERRRDSRELYRKKPHLESKFKELFTSRSKATTKAAVTPEIKKMKTSKSSNAAVITEQPAKKSPNKQTCEPDCEVQFDIRTYSSETHQVTHDYSKETSRSISDYNLDILTKTYSADIYINEISSVIKKIMTCTPLEFVLDIPKPPTKLASKKVITATDKPSTSRSQTKSNPLHILYNQLIKPASVPSRPSPLEDLYSPEPTSRNYKKSSETNVDRLSDRSKKNEKMNRSKHKTELKEKQLAKETQVTDEDNKSECDNKQIVGEDEANIEKSDDLIGGLSRDFEKNEHQIMKLSLKRLDVVDGVIMLNSNSGGSNNEQESEENFQMNDELMNYAIVGSERVEDTGEEFLMTDNRKRKTSAEAEGEISQEKKQKTEGCTELLRNIDVDSFLKKLHGDS